MLVCAFGCDFRASLFRFIPGIIINCVNFGHIFSPERRRLSRRMRFNILSSVAIMVCLYLCVRFSLDTGRRFFLLYSELEFSMRCCRHRQCTVPIWHCFHWQNQTVFCVSVSVSTHFLCVQYTILYTYIFIPIMPRVDPGHSVF